MGAHCGKIVRRCVTANKLHVSPASQNVCSKLKTLLSRHSLPSRPRLPPAVHALATGMAR